jgi:GNAT superfamily N-acetyltransferase
MEKPAMNVSQLQNLPNPVGVCRIREGKPDDVSTILRFIRELAEYERLLHEVEATEAQLARTLFGENTVASVLIAEVDDLPVGFALYFYNYSTFLAKPGIYLEDLYVQPQARGRGIGKALLKHLAQLAVREDCGRLEWRVLDWNEPSIAFYKSLGAKPLDDWTTYSVAGKALYDLAQ